MKPQIWIKDKTLRLLTDSAALKTKNKKTYFDFYQYSGILIIYLHRVSCFSIISNICWCSSTKSINFAKLVEHLTYQYINCMFIYLIVGVFCPKQWWQQFPKSQISLFHPFWRSAVSENVNSGAAVFVHFLAKQVNSWLEDLLCLW